MPPGGDNRPKHLHHLDMIRRWLTDGLPEAIADRRQHRGLRDIYQTLRKTPRIGPFLGFPAHHRPQLHTAHRPRRRELRRRRTRSARRTLEMLLEHPRMEPRTDHLLDDRAPGARASGPHIRIRRPVGTSAPTRRYPKTRFARCRNIHAKAIPRSMASPSGGESSNGSHRPDRSRNRSSLLDGGSTQQSTSGGTHTGHGGQSSPGPTANGNFLSTTTTETRFR